MKHWKRIGHSVLNRFGLDIVRSRTVNDSLERHLRNVLDAKGIDCVIDVGANAGQYGQSLRALGFEGHIVSFEPVASVFEALRRKADEDGKWTCHQVALGAEAGTRALNVYASTVFSSFHEANAYSKGIWKSLESVRQEPVRVQRLDEVYGPLVEDLGCRRPLLKLDTQGHDRQVFEGAAGCLGQIQALQSEVSLIPIYYGANPGLEALRAFNDAGFYVSGMYPVNRDESMAVIEYDCVLVRRSAGVQAGSNPSSLHGGVHLPT